MRKRFLSTRVLRAVVLAVGGAIVFATSGVPAAAASFQFTLGGSEPTQKPFAVTSGAGTWYFTISATGTVNTLVLSIRDSSPGDFCWYWSKKRPGSTEAEATNMPLAEPNACFGSQYPDNEDPLVFFAGFQGGKSGRVTITVTYPDPPQP